MKTLPGRFQRRPLRADVQNEILDRLVDLRLPPGSRINESHLAAELGLSRTPLREAMLTLAAWGFLTSDMGHGFQVPVLSTGEFGDIQDALLLLWPATLQVSPPTSPDVLMQLNNLLGRVRLHPDRPGLFASLAMQWAASLLQDFPNQLLAREILRLEGLVRRYRFRAAQAGFSSVACLDSLEQVYEALRRQNPDEARNRWLHHHRECQLSLQEFLAGILD